jgi:hypothetical protein
METNATWEFSLTHWLLHHFVGNESLSNSSKNSGIVLLLIYNYYSHYSKARSERLTGFFKSLLCRIKRKDSFLDFISFVRKQRLMNAFMQYMISIFYFLFFFSLIFFSLSFFIFSLFFPSNLYIIFSFLNFTVNLVKLWWERKIHIVVFCTRYGDFFGLNCYLLIF